MTESLPAPRRRATLETAANPAGRDDCLVILVGVVAPESRITLRYVPDRWIVTSKGFSAYLAVLPLDATPESLATLVLDDLNNEVVPRWAEVMVERPTPFSHRVLATDHQPEWSNPGLLARLAPV